MAGSVVPEWLTAVGTIGAAWMAVYAAIIREYRRRPELTLTFDPSPAAQDGVIVDVTGVDPLWDAWFRLRVQAKPNRAAAEDVEVMVTGARVLPDQPINIGGQLLAWSNTAVGLIPAPRMTIPPDGYRHVDLVHVRHMALHTPVEPSVQFEVRPLPTDDRNRVAAGTYEIELVVTARNVEARRYRVNVAWDGRWGPERDSIREHLTVASPERIKD